MRRLVLLTILICSTAAIAESDQRDVGVVRPVREIGTVGPMPVLRSGKWGYVNRDGTVAISPQFEEAGFFYDGRAAARQNGLWGYIDAVGVAVVPFQFTNANRFSDGLANVRWKAQQGGPDLSGYIDKSGQIVIKCDGQDADIRLTAQRCYQQFSGGFVMEVVEAFRCAEEPDNPKQYPCKGQWINRIGFYDKTGRLAIPGPFWSAGAVSRFVDGLAGVQVLGSEQKGFIDSSGRWAINPQFEQISTFNEGLAGVRTGGLWGFIDKRGEFVIRPQFVSAPSGFSDGLAAVSVDGKYGYIDRTGKSVIAPQFRDAGPFSEGLAPVCCDQERIRYIDAKGRWAFALTLSGVVWDAPFLDGIALVELEQSVLAYIDRAGRVIARMRKAK